jgi:GntR family transcriptional regulator/MocR family aminotransferase
VKAWTYRPEVPDGDAPIFLRIAQTLSGDIAAGRLKAGTKLPGTRTLATQLNVHRNTVIAAFDELMSQGWTETRPAGGTYVASDFPAPLPDTRSSASASALGYSLPDAPIPSHWDDPWRVASRASRPGTLALASGLPDIRLVPVDLISRAYRRAMRLHGLEVLGYGDPQGHERLRVELAAMLGTLRGLAIGPQDIVITRGSQLALDLVARALIRPGDRVAIENLGYRPAWDALRLAGADLAPVPVDESGIRVDALAALIGAGDKPIRAIYVTPHHQYPTTVVMAPARRLALLDLARRHRFAIIEDDYDNEFHYGGRPVLPLASANAHGSVVYIGTLSKILAPGLRTGFVVAPAPLAKRLADIRMLSDRQGDMAVEVALASLINDGELQRHANRMRRVYRARRDALADALTAAFADNLVFTPPQGGMAIWATFDPGIDVEAWARRGFAAGIHFSPASRFTCQGKAPNALRLGFASLDEREIGEAVRRMKQTLR